MSAAPEIVIEAGDTERSYRRDLCRYRELFYFLARHDALATGNLPIGKSMGRLQPFLRKGSS